MKKLVLLSIILCSAKVWAQTPIDNMNALNSKLSDIREYSQSQDGDYLKNLEVTPGLYTYLIEDNSELISSSIILSNREISIDNFKAYVFLKRLLAYQSDWMIFRSTNQEPKFRKKISFALSIKGEPFKRDQLNPVVEKYEKNGFSVINLKNEIKLVKDIWIIGIEYNQPWNQFDITLQLDLADKSRKDIETIFERDKANILRSLSNFESIGCDGFYAKAFWL